MQLHHTQQSSFEAGVQPLNFDTSGFEDQEARRLCASLLSDIIGRVTIESGHGLVTGAKGMRCLLSTLRVMTCFLPPHPTRLHGSGERNARRVLMLRSMEGPLCVRQDGIAVDAEAGDFLLLSAERPYECHLPQGGRLDCGSLPVTALRMPRERLDALMLRPIPRNFAPLQLLITYGAYLLVNAPHSAAEADIASIHFSEILPLVVAYLAGPGNAANQNDRLAAIKAYIEGQLANSELTIADVAGNQGLTPRSIQKLFQQEGTTFSKFLLERRLDAASRSLRQAGGTTPISTIAYEVGFGDLSYFNRTFRRRYGKAPSDFLKQQD